jgi:hypothetical protein
MHLSILPSLSPLFLSAPLLVLTACPIFVNYSEGGDDIETTDTETSDTETSDTDESETSPEASDTGSEGSECASSCADQIACGFLEPSDLGECTSQCELIVEGYATVFGDACAEAKQAWLSCVADESCDAVPASEDCEDFAITVYFACTETVLPDLDALCECLAQDLPPSGDLFDAKQTCVIDTGEQLIEVLTESGDACFDAYGPVIACQADACADPACASEPAPESCSCAAADDGVLAACE